MDNNKRKNGYKKYKLQTILNNLDVVKQLKAGGATNAQIASHFNISSSSFYNYINQSDELKQALESGVVELVNDLEGELYRKAMKHTLTTTRTTEKNGEITTEIVEKEVDGDSASLIFMLKNLAPEKWVNEPKMLEIKKQELELKKQIAKNNMW